MTVKTIALKTNIVNNHNLERRAFKVLVTLLLALFLSYIFFTSRIILNIIARRVAEGSLRALTAEVSELELRYISADNNIDLKYAQNLGFSEARKIYFARRAALVGNISIVRNEL